MRNFDEYRTARGRCAATYSETDKDSSEWIAYFQNLLHDNVSCPWMSFATAWQLLARQFLRPFGKLVKLQTPNWDAGKIRCDAHYSRIPLYQCTYRLSGRTYLSHTSLDSYRAEKRDLNISCIAFLEDSCRRMFFAARSFRTDKPYCMVDSVTSQRK